MPTLARLSLWVPPERMDTFETTYKKKLVPILKQHDLEESSERGRRTVAGVFSRLFEVRMPSEVAVKEIALRTDAVWQEVLQSLGTAFGTTQPDGLLHTYFGLYKAPAGPGKTVEAGPGSRQGVWQTFEVSDGLPSPCILDIFQDRAGDLWFGTRHGGVSRYDGRQFVTFTTEDGLAHNSVRSILEDREGVLWFGTRGGGVSRYDGKEFATFTTEDGLAHNRVRPILEDRDGALWFGTLGGGVSRYDGKEFATFTTEDGLAANRVQSILEDREGHLWFGTEGGGVSRYDARRPDGAQFVTFTMEDGLAGNGVHAIVEDREGVLWFGAYWGGPVSRDDGIHFSEHAGVSRYDGRQFVTFTTEDGLASNRVQAILEDRKGHLWFGTNGGGVSRYDPSASSGGTGEEFVTFTTENGLADNAVYAILEDRKGVLWFGTSGGGVSRYDAHRPDGEQFVTFTTRDGLAHNDVRSIFEDREGVLWFGTWGGGVSRYDGAAFVTFTAEDGLAYNMVTCIFQDREGDFWFGMWGRGVSRYDGLVFQNLVKRDGLVSNTVQHILQDRNGELWIATEGGITRYRPRHTPPSIRFTDVIADRRYGSVGEIRIPLSQKLLTFEFRGSSFTTRPDGMAYVYRLEGYDPDWRVVYTGRAEYEDLPLGEYTFRVKAVDRDLNYSEPAAIRIIIEADPRLEALTQALSASGTSERFVGESPALRRVEEEIAKIAPTNLTVLILGETGTGKGLAARAVHGLSPRRRGPFIQVNCGAIPEGLVESELFGHERGAFTGATSRKLGQIEVAEGGTLFLDEIGDLAPEAQAKLLQFLEERTFERVGGTETLQVDVRVMAATNRDLVQMVEAGPFREDLYFRLQEFTLVLPPLRERRGDIRLLAEYFMERMAAHLNRDVTHLSPEALAALEGYDWPGNVRELEHAVKRAVVVCPGTAIRAEDITLELGKRAEGPPKDVQTLEEVERRHIREVLEQTGGVVKGPRGASTMLGVHESTLRSRMKKLGIARP